MLSRTVIALAAVVVVVISSGVGYASCGGKGPPQNLQLVWTGTPSATPTANCAATGTSSTLTVTASKLAPGSTCTIDGTLLNSGNVNGWLYSYIQITWPSTCLSRTVSGYTFTDNIGSSGQTLNAGKTYGFIGKFGLVSSAPNSCELSKATVLDTITLSQNYQNPW